MLVRLLIALAVNLLLASAVLAGTITYLDPPNTYTTACPEGVVGVTQTNDGGLVAECGNFDTEEVLCGGSISWAPVTEGQIVVLCGTGKP